VPGSDTCALDVADRGPLNLAEVGRHFGLSGEMIRRIEADALAHARAAAERMGVQLESLLLGALGRRG
jgi:DNA-directed RNA polymerase sigma subunit (sigma70/sigma32)